MVTTPLDDLRTVAAEMREDLALGDFLSDYAERIESAVAALAPVTLPQLEDADVVIPTEADMPTLERIEEEPT